MLLSFQAHLQSAFASGGVVAGVKLGRYKEADFGSWLDPARFLILHLLTRRQVRMPAHLFIAVSERREL